MRRKKGQTQLDLEQLWRKAYQTPGGHKIPCLSKAEAVRVRYSLYNAVKWVRDARSEEEPDDVLLEAVLECSVGLIGEESNIVHLYRKQDSPAMQAIRAAIGGPAPDTESIVLDESAKRMLEAQRQIDAERAAAPAPKELVNPSPARNYPIRHGGQGAAAFMAQFESGSGGTGQGEGDAKRED